MRDKQKMQEILSDIENRYASNGEVSHLAGLVVSDWVVSDWYGSHDVEDDATPCMKLLVYALATFD